MKPKANIRGGMSIYAIGIAFVVPTFRSRKVAIKKIAFNLLKILNFTYPLTFSQHAVPCRSLPTADLMLSPQTTLKPKPLLMFKSMDYLSQTGDTSNHIVAENLHTCRLRQMPMFRYAKTRVMLHGLVAMRFVAAGRT